MTRLAPSDNFTLISPSDNFILATKQKSCASIKHYLPSYTIIFEL